MILILGIFPALYIAWIIIVKIAWNKIPGRDPHGPFSVPVCVIIPVRNEEAFIAGILSDLDIQDYPREMFTVIVMDDGSTDRTPDIVNEIKKKVRYTLIYNPPQSVDSGVASKGKKAMISLAVSKAKQDIILQTDADCRVGPRWISSMVSGFRDPGINFVTGPVSITDSGKLFNRLAMLDLAGLMVTTAAMIKLGYPALCNGACMAYRKSAFTEIGGYIQNKDVASGDDSFLMHAIEARYPGSVGFIKYHDAMVSTAAPPSWKEFFNQRLRWAGKWKYHRNMTIKGLAIFIFLTHLGFLLLFAWTLLFSQYLSFFIWIALKLTAEAILLNSWHKTFRIKFNLSAFFMAGIFYPLYAVFFGILANTVTFTWKGRTLRH